MRGLPFPSCHDISSAGGGLRRSLAGLIGAALGLAVAAAPARAADGDAGAWFVQSARVDLAPHWSASLETQTRLLEDFGRPALVVARGFITRDLSPDVAVSLGGDAFIERRDGEDRHERRLWPQLRVGVAAPFGAHLALRTRLDIRWREDGDDAAFTLREQARLSKPVGECWSVFGASEVFFGLNDADWGPHDGLQQYRLGGGVGVKLSKALSAEAAYMRQQLVRDGPDAVNDVVVLRLDLRL